MNTETEEVRMLSNIIGPLFHGRQPEIVTSTLADLMATLLAGFQGEGCDKLREEWLTKYVNLIRRLIPINEKEMLKRIRRDAH